MFSQRSIPKKKQRTGVGEISQVTAMIQKEYKFVRILHAAREEASGCECRRHQPSEVLVQYMSGKSVPVQTVDATPL